MITQKCVYKHTYSAHSPRKTAHATAGMETQTRHMVTYCQWVEFNSVISYKVGASRLWQYAFKQSKCYKQVKVTKSDKS